MSNLCKRLSPFQPLVLSIIGGLLAYILIPSGFSRYNEVKALREARVTRAVKFGDLDNAFNNRMNAIESLMAMYDSHNHRMKICCAELKQARKEFTKNYWERYLELDATTWWWPGDFVREADALNLLSPDELNQLDADAKAYGQSVLTTVNAIKPLWHFLDSTGYKVDEKSKGKVADMKAQMEKEFQQQHQIRYELVRKISLLCANSNFRTGWRDLLVPG